MKTIYKYQLSITDIQSIKMPQGAEILSIQCQDNSPCVWALVDTDNLKEDRSFLMYGTGNPVDENYKKKYIGTFMMYSGSLVFHCFEFI
jgi:hypothetical protein